MDHAHRQGVIHRDLRPGNVLVTEQGMVKVADFGTSRFLEIAAHGTTVIGSPPYMAPEQFQGKAVFASDIYSLGVTMYQMLTGALPYNTPPPADLERLMRGELTTPPRERNPKIPKGISDIVMKAMAPDIAVALPARRRSARRGAGRAGPARRRRVRAPTPPAPPAPSGVRGGRHRSTTPTASEQVDDIQARLKAREAPQARFCWHCRKPLHARTDHVPVLRRSRSRIPEPSSADYTDYTDSALHTLDGSAGQIHEAQLPSDEYLAASDVRSQSRQSTAALMSIASTARMTQKARAPTTDRTRNLRNLRNLRTA